MKLCIDCKHHRLEKFRLNGEQLHMCDGITWLIDGAKGAQLCKTARGGMVSPAHSFCGPAGALWEAKADVAASDTPDPDRNPFTADGWNTK
jgi:hypothetical protein